MIITAHQRQVLVEQALESNWTDSGAAAEEQYADVIADLAMGRDISDRDLFVRFLWRRVTMSLEAGPSRREHWVWSAAVQLLDQLDETLDDIFTGRQVNRDELCCDARSDGYRRGEWRRGAANPR
jgi:hypothetical protein